MRELDLCVPDTDSVTDSASFFREDAGQGVTSVYSYYNDFHAVWNSVSIWATMNAACLHRFQGDFFLAAKPSAYGAYLPEQA
jgi:hypothetical protein